MNRFFLILITSSAIGVMLGGHAQAEDATTLLLTDPTITAETRSNWDVALRSDGIKLVPADQVSAAMAFTGAEPTATLGEGQIATLRDKLGAASVLVVTTKPLQDGKLAIEVASHRSNGVRREYATADAAELPMVTLPVLLRLARAPVATAPQATQPKTVSPVPTSQVPAGAGAIAPSPAIAGTSTTQVGAVATVVAPPRGPEAHRRALSLMNIPGELGGFGIGYRSYRPMPSYELGYDIGVRWSSAVDETSVMAVDTFTIPANVSARWSKVWGNLAMGSRVGAGVQLRREGVRDTEDWKLFLSPGVLLGLDLRYAINSKVSALCGVDLSVSVHSELMMAFGLAF